MEKRDRGMIRTGACLGALMCVWLIILTAQPAGALDIPMGGNTLVLHGYVNQSAQWGVAGDHYDTKEGFQAAISQILLESTYRVGANVTLFASGNLNMDLAYPLMDGNNEWESKLFDKADDDLFLLDESYTLLKECHATFGLGDWVLRLGKQIVVWGETDGIRIMDQINPQDLRRGISDVEFETMIMPIWLAKAEYFPKNTPSWMQDLGLEFIFNPNAHFIKNFDGDAANQVAGIWAYNVLMMPGVRLGTTHPSSNIEEPDNWDSDGYEYGMRVKTIIDDNIITLNYFDGVANSQSTLFRNLIPAGADLQGDPDNYIMDMVLEGKYADQRFAGFTLSRDLTFLRVPMLGGVSPVMRFEALYGFDVTYATSGRVVTGDPSADPFLQNFEQHDEIKAAIGIDWKIRIPFLNPRDSFSVGPQFIYHRILDYPEEYKLAASILTYREENYNASLMVRTTYFHNKLAPMVFWQRSLSGGDKYDTLIARLDYTHNHCWSYALTHTMVTGDSVGTYYGHKDNIGVTVSYQF